jgi:hypothetical protein
MTPAFLLHFLSLCRLATGAVDAAASVLVTRQTGDVTEMPAASIPAISRLHENFSTVHVHPSMATEVHSQTIAACFTPGVGHASGKAYVHCKEKVVLWTS